MERNNNKGDAMNAEIKLTKPQEAYLIAFLTKDWTNTKHNCNVMSALYRKGILELIRLDNFRSKHVLTETGREIAEKLIG